MNSYEVPEEMKTSSLLFLQRQICGDARDILTSVKVDSIPELISQSVISAIKNTKTKGK